MADPSMLVTEGVRPTMVTTDNCVLEIRKEYEVIPSVACFICFMLGTVYCFFGESGDGDGGGDTSTTHSHLLADDAKLCIVLD